MIDALFEHLLGVIGVLRDPLLGRGRLGEVAQEARQAFKGLAGQLDLAPRHRLNPLDGELVGLAQRLDIAALRGPKRLDIEGPEAEIGKQLGHIEIEEVGTGIRHGAGSDQGSGFVQCTMPISAASVRCQGFPVQRSNFRLRQWPRGRAGRPHTSARCRAGGGRAPPWSAPDPATRPSAKSASSPYRPPRSA